MLINRIYFVDELNKDNIFGGPEGTRFPSYYKIFIEHGDGMKDLSSLFTRESFIRQFYWIRKKYVFDKKNYGFPMREGGYAMTK